MKLGWKIFDATPWSKRALRGTLWDNGRNTLEAMFHVMGVVVKYGRGQKTIEKKNYILKYSWPDNQSTTQRNPKSSQLLLQAIWWVSWSPVSVLLFLQPEENFLEVLKISGNTWKKNSHNRNLHQNSLLDTMLKLFLNSCNVLQFDPCRMR